MAAQGLKTAK